MPISIAGMHRSGTSMISRLLNCCGLDLGPAHTLMRPAPENAEGFWESIPFYTLSEDVLREIGGSWCTPPELSPGWENADHLASLRQRAAALPTELGMKEPWGWKDPRNCLLLPFWRAVWPELRVVICVRHPLEVANSLLERDRMPFSRGFELWLQYYQRLLESVPVDGSVVTRYEAYFADPATEVRRVLAVVGIAATDDAIQQACAAVVPALRHGRLDGEELDRLPVPPAVSEMYQRLTALAGAPAPAAANPAKGSSMLANALRWAMELESHTGALDWSWERERRLRVIDHELTAARTKARHVMNLLLIEHARRRHADQAIRHFQECLSARRHRYADRIAELLLKLLRPFRRKPQPPKKTPAASGKRPSPSLRAS